jgi:hypothetical protein
VEVKRSYSLKEILDLQDNLNEQYIPNWKFAMRPEMYFTQVIDEASELLRSGIEYKWWSNVPEEKYNAWNVKIEAVDMIFFIASMFALANQEEDERDSLAIFDLSVPAEMFECEEHYNSLRFVEVANKINHATFAAIIADVSDALMNGLSVWRAPVMSVIAHAADMTAEEASAVYAAKYELNRFRISEDYKSGAYQKVVDGVEDNERLRVVVERFNQDVTMSLDDVRSEVIAMFFRKDSNK